MAYMDREDLNYLGVLLGIGQSQTPFLNMIGGLNGAKRAQAFQFPLSAAYALAAASQDTQSEATARAAGTAVTTALSQAYNVCQIMKKDVEATFAVLSANGELAGLSQVGSPAVTDKLGFQKLVQMKQLAKDINYSFLRGSFVDSSLASTNMKTRGMLEACASNTKDAGGAKLSSELLNDLLATMWGNGSDFQQPVIFCGIKQKQALSDEYGFAPQDRNIGGVAVQQIETDVGRIGVVLDPDMLSTSILVADVAKCAPVIVPFEGQLVSWNDLGMAGASRGGFWYTQIGLDYAHEKFHGTITDLAV